MPDVDTVRSWQGRTMVDRDGDKVGTIESIYLDDQTGQPEWALVNTGLFGTKPDLRAPRPGQAYRRQRPGPVREAAGQGRPQHGRRRPPVPAGGAEL